MGGQKNSGCRGPRIFLPAHHAAVRARSARAAACFFISPRVLCGHRFSGLSPLTIPFLHIGSGPYGRPPPPQPPQAMGVDHGRGGPGRLFSPGGDPPVVGTPSLAGAGGEGRGGGVIESAWVERAWPLDKLFVNCYNLG